MLASQRRWLTQMLRRLPAETRGPGGQRKLLYLVSMRGLVGTGDRRCDHAGTLRHHSLPAYVLAASDLLEGVSSCPDRINVCSPA